jgi:TetR/AcrR family transcriptional regulator, transcriptional repressor for nem operon
MNTTAERPLDLAESHMRNAGYGDFSFRELAAKVGIKSASVHHDFPTKASMAAAVARCCGNRFFVAVDRRPWGSAARYRAALATRDATWERVEAAGSAARPTRRMS